MLGVEHFGKESDGFCITLLLEASSAELSRTGKGSPYQWTLVADTTMALRLKNALVASFGCAKFCP